MDDETRRELLHEVRRPSGTVGKDLPDELTVQGTTVDVREFVFDCKRLDTIPESERERIEEVESQLRRERLQRKQRLEDGDITETEGKKLVRSIHGLDRALTALEGLDTPDIEEELRQKKLEDARELLALIR
ncbi:DUF5788 family protein [Haloarchaeobius litoreus]|uniref:DUF5788 family protein n=1 Tax=Haloarchaeobius litoreus TaxID=755306 RepID=A0ABD6DLU2_9EURY|nr:DUF5788 family protein [Haloarchaeobius litoreus]